MIECIFTIDYEIYGNGDGSLEELVFAPADKLNSLFRQAGCKFVAFIEAAELELIQDQGSDPAIGLISEQIKSFHNEGIEIGLHLHPQWYKARHENGQWRLDYSEYNLCTLPRERIAEIVDRSISYLRRVLGQPDFTPLSFRAGNWLMQPTHVAAGVLAERGIKLDSSVFKGGLQHRHGLDYRKAIGNGYYWTFSDHVDMPDANGTLLEIPTYTEMVPFWKMLTMKRVGMKGAGNDKGKGLSSHSLSSARLERLIDFLRFRYPLKLDYCRMTIDELTKMMGAIVREDRKAPGRYRPIVAIGHTKDLVDYETIRSFLAYLQENGIRVSTFKDVYDKCKT
ncbi:hypothetical protein V2P20_02630 [Methylobacter sp. Wu1]|uniref:hypothetical protein n=1 Tax=Methylobacter sp. Wu1 TaxID=3119359 RepID=UPI002F95F4E6